MEYNFFTQRGPMISGTHTELNHLGAALAMRPQKLEGAMTELFATSMYSDNAMTSELIKNKSTVEVGTNTWEYDIIAGICRPATVLKSSYVSTATIKPGEGTGILTLDLDTNIYIHGDVLSAGGTDKSLQIRVLDKIELGKITRYRFRIMNDNINKFIPFKNVKAGALWGKLYSQYEEGSDQSGSTYYNAPTSITGSLSRYRKMYKVTGDAANEVLNVAMKDAKGNMYKSWVRYAESVLWKQWYKELEKGLWYSRRTTKVFGSTNRPLYTGAGIQQQMESGLRHFYNTLTGSLLRDFIMDMRYGRVLPSQTDTVIGFTGEYGMLAFHDAVTQAAGKEPIFTLQSDNFIKPVSSQYSPNALQFGARFTQWLLPNGVTLKLIHNPIYDDPEVNFELDPLTGKPVESMRITFFNVGGDKSMSNVKLVNKKGGFKNWYVAGGQNPYGPVINGLGSHSGDYYEMHILQQQGIQIMDPTSCGELILQRA